MLKVIELFSGIGSQTQALKNIGLSHEVVGISEIDTHAIQSYEAIHGKVNNLGDITKIENLPNCDLLTYSFPCTDLSTAGKQKGITEHTRSGLLFQVERLLKEYNKEDLPKFLLLENVKNLVSQKFKPDFNRWLIELEKLGYDNYWQVLNSKDYNIPQNRERVFVVSIRKDLDLYYEFPKKIKPNKHLKSFLDTRMNDSIKELTIDDSVYKCVKENFKREGKDIIDSCKNIYRPKCKSGFHDNVVGIKIIQCIRAENSFSAILDGLIIRNTIPLEKWRLMGFTDESFYKAKNSGVSDNQLNRQAGNSIVVNVLMEIFRNLFCKDLKRLSDVHIKLEDCF